MVLFLVSVIAGNFFSSGASKIQCIGRLLREKLFSEGKILNNIVEHKSCFLDLLARPFLVSVVKRRKTQSSNARQILPKENLMMLLASKVDEQCSCKRTA